MSRLGAACLFITGVGNALPLLGVLGAARLETMYGISIGDPGLLLLLQHRALLFGLLGGFMMLAAFHAPFRTAALAAGLVSMLGFVGLAVLNAPNSAPIERIVIADLVLSALLLPVLAQQLGRLLQRRREIVAG